MFVSVYLHRLKAAYRSGDLLYYEGISKIFNIFYFSGQRIAKFTLWTIILNFVSSKQSSSKSQCTLL